jgi:hypothetical protein
VVILAGLLAACASTSTASSPASSTAPPAAPTSMSSTPRQAVRPPPAHGRFDYQIGGPYSPMPDVRIVERDRRVAPAAGRYNICYVNAFQTQPEENAFWTRRHRTLLLRIGGRYVLDPDWPGEYVLDTSTAAKRAAIAEILDEWFAGCAARGYDAVEPDNLDSWTRSNGRLTRSDNSSLAQLLVLSAHQHGLAVAQKNSPELAPQARRIGFDFAVAEECAVYDECAAYTAAYGAHVLEIEYTDNGRTAFRRSCASRGKQISVILRDRAVVPRGHPGYVYQAC